MLALMEMYVEGVSTRKVREITEVLCGTSFSKSLVSELAGQLDAELEAWRNRPLIETTYPYLSVARLLEDAIEDCLACLAFSLAHRARIRTTNGLERLNEEIKRRTRVVPDALRADSRIRQRVCDW